MKPMCLNRPLILIMLLFSPLVIRAETLLVVGDSISAGYGLDRVEEGWVSLLGKKLEARGIQVVNAGISGDTSAGGLDRMGGLLKRYSPSIVVIELGGNDGLRGLTPAQMEHNLDAMVELARQVSAQTLLLGMKMPPNYGARYADMFERVYRDVARKQQIALLPFLLEGVGGQTELMQADGIHPNRQAQPIIAEQVVKALEPLLDHGRPKKVKKKVIPR